MARAVIDNLRPEVETSRVPRSQFYPKTISSYFFNILSLISSNSLTEIASLSLKAGITIMLAKSHVKAFRPPADKEGISLQVHPAVSMTQTCQVSVAY
jgi:hypothetical protein